MPNPNLGIRLYEVAVRIDGSFQGTVQMLSRDPVQAASDAETLLSMSENELLGPQGLGLLQNVNEGQIREARILTISEIDE